MLSSGSIFQPRRLGHVNLTVGRLDVAVNFYRDICGLNVEFTESGIKAAFMGTGHTPHDVGMIERGDAARHGRDGRVQIPKGAVSAVSLNHIAWEVATEADLVRSYGRVMLADPQSKPRTLDHMISKSVYLKDPDGNTVEFYADSIRNWRGVLSGDVELITSAWEPGKGGEASEWRGSDEPDRRIVRHALVQPTRLSHVVLATAQLAPMTEFYRSVAGLEQVHEHENGILLRATSHGTPYQLALVRSDATGLHHYAFEVEDPAQWGRAVAALRERAEPGVHFRSGPVKESVYLRDPDGFLIEFYRRKSADYGQAFGLVAEERLYAL